MTTLKGFLIFVLVGYAGLVGAMYLLQRSLMYFPEKLRTAPAAAGLAQAQEMTLDTSDGEKIIAWYIPAAEAKPVILYFHGNGGSLRLRVDRFRKLTAEGVGLLAVSYRGYGGSTGSPTQDGLMRDALAAYDYVAARYAPERIVVFGESLGSAVAVPLAAQKKVGKLILDAPFTSAVDIAAAVYPYIPVRWLMKDQFRSDEHIGRVQAPVLVLHGELDRVVPISFGERLYAMITARKQFVRFSRGNHSDLDSHGAQTAIHAFLRAEAHE